MPAPKVRDSKPNNLQKHEDCVQMKQKMWDDINCNSTLSFVCEFSKYSKLMFLFVKILLLLLYLNYGTLLYKK